MRKPTYTIDTKPYATTMSRTFEGHQKKSLPSPVPTPKRRPSDDQMTLPLPRSFIGDVQNALRRSVSPKGFDTTQSPGDKLESPKAKGKGISKWAAKIGLSSSSSTAKADPKKP